MAPIIRIIVKDGIIGAIILIVNHLGINPVIGGSPLNDKSSKGIVNWVRGE
jgi:hypothetical protein